MAWTVVANTARSSAAAAKAAAVAADRASHPQHLTAAQAKAAQTGLYDHALSAGFSRGFIVSAGIMVLALLVAIVMIRVTREDLAGVRPIPGPRPGGPSSPAFAGSPKTSSSRPAARCDAGHTRIG